MVAINSLLLSMLSRADLRISAGSSIEAVGIGTVEKVPQVILKHVARGLHALPEQLGLELGRALIPTEKARRARRCQHPRKPC